jgi:anti-anti-sigma regulatory factor
MLNITMHNEPDLATFVLEGKLSGAWVDEFQHCYHMLSVFPHEKSVVVDLSGVTSMDTAGEDLLLQIRQDGAELVTGKPPGELSLEQVRGAPFEFRCFGLFWPHLWSPMLELSCRAWEQLG